MTGSHRTTSDPSAEVHPGSAPEYHRDIRSVAYFNDAVFAIAMTLLVVSIRVPAGTSADTLGQALQGMGSAFTAYGISFIVIGFYWLGYHRQLHYLARFDGGALLIDLLLLMSVAFLPFPTLLLNDYFGSVLVIFYASAMAVSGSLLGMLWIYQARHRLLRGRWAAEPLFHASRPLASDHLPGVDPCRGRGSSGSSVHVDPRPAGPAPASSRLLPLSQSSRGCPAFYVKNAAAEAWQFMITISKAATARETVKVAYFVTSPNG